MCRVRYYENLAVLERPMHQQSPNSSLIGGLRPERYVRSRFHISRLKRLVAASLRAVRRRASVAATEDAVAHPRRLAVALPGLGLCAWHVGGAVKGVRDVRGGVGSAGVHGHGREGEGGGDGGVDEHGEVSARPPAAGWSRSKCGGAYRGRCSRRSSRESRRGSPQPRRRRARPTASPGSRPPSR